jgi:hypothetical protein
MKFEALSVARQRARLFYCRLARKGHAASLIRPRLLSRPNTRPKGPSPEKRTIARAPTKKPTAMAATRSAATTPKSKQLSIYRQLNGARDCASLTDQLIARYGE